MPILTACACGFRFKAPDRLAGKKARCPKCNQILQIPASTAEATILEEAPPPAPVNAPLEEQAPAAPGMATSPDQETDEGPSALPGSEPVQDAPAPDEAKPEEKPAEAEEKPAEEKPA